MNNNLTSNLYAEGEKLFKNKEYQKALENFKQTLESIDDKSQDLQTITITEWYIGRCYLEQAIKEQNKQQATEYFSQAITHHQKQLELAKQLSQTNQKKGLYQQINAQSWLGHCYLEQAIKEQNKQQATEYFKLAIKHNNEWLVLAKDKIIQQIYAQSCIGRCYFEQAIREQDKQQATKYFKLAIKHNNEWLVLAKSEIIQQIYAQSWLGRCYFEQAIKEQDKQQATEYFKLAIKHNNEWLVLAKNEIIQQIYAQSWLGRCYFEQAIKEQSADYFSQAITHYKEQLKLAKKLLRTNQENGLNQQINNQISLEQQIYAQHWLGRCYLEKSKIEKDKKNILEKAIEAINKSLQLCEKINSNNIPKYKIENIRMGCYFEKSKIHNNSEKKDDIDKYFEIKVNLISSKIQYIKDQELQDCIAKIQAILLISPTEIDKITFAHYTTPNVCHILFGLNENTSPENGFTYNPMRMNSSTYMNDPLEGKSLLEFLGKQDLEIENKNDVKENNAFFSCFSVRVNDLNQFRLYGKEDNVEASGCCLVFPKYKLVKDEYINPFRLKDNNNLQNEELDESYSNTPENNLPLYQIAYIFYKDNYLSEDEYNIFKNNEENKFGIRLKPISNNKEWEKFRRDTLSKELDTLKNLLETKKLEDKDSALEYIRYLFKDYAFRDEEEFRLLRIEPITSKEEVKYCQETKSLYLEYREIGDMVEEVILGTNYENTSKKRKTEVFKHLLCKNHSHIKVSHSSLPISRPYEINKDSK